MATSYSGVVQKVAGMPPKRVASMDRNEWSVSSGIAGRHGPEDAVICRLVLLPKLNQEILYLGKVF